MNDSSVTAEILDPYAQAMMAIAKSHDLVDPFSDNAAYILELFKQSTDLTEFLSSPVMEDGVKKNVLRQLFAEHVHPFVMNFMMLLVDRKRIMFLQGICKQFQALVREQRQIVLAEVISAVPLSDEQQEAVRQKVLAITNAQQVELEMSQDADLIGGVIIKIGSQVIDASLRGQLRRISLKLSAST
jgi:F-type H+-transporting ATPase subunit delta